MITRQKIYDDRVEAFKKAIAEMPLAVQPEDEEDQRVASQNVRHLQDELAKFEANPTDFVDRQVARLITKGYEVEGV